MCGFSPVHRMFQSGHAPGRAARDNKLTWSRSDWRRHRGTSVVGYFDSWNGNAHDHCPPDPTVDDALTIRLSNDGQ